MQKEEKGCVIGSLLAAIGLWTLYWIQSFINIPMWIYKGVLSFSIVYFPWMFILEAKRANEISENNESKQTDSHKVPSMKVYGSQNKK